MEVKLSQSPWCNREKDWDRGLKFDLYLLKICGKTNTWNTQWNIQLFKLEKGEYLLKHPLNLNLNIAHLSGYFMEDKLITEQAAKSVSRMIFKGSMHLF